MFFIVNVLNNYALNFNISMPLHIIFRSVSECFVTINLNFYRIQYIVRIQLKMRIEIQPYVVELLELFKP